MKQSANKEIKTLWLIVVSSSIPTQFFSCQMLEGWGCCPILDAVCCSDDSNCCPHGSQCNMTTDTCDWPHQIYVRIFLSFAIISLSFSIFWQSIDLEYWNQKTGFQCLLICYILLEVFFFLFCLCSALSSSLSPLSNIRLVQQSFKALRKNQAGELIRPVWLWHHFQLIYLWLGFEFTTSISWAD